MATSMLAAAAGGTLAMNPHLPGEILNGRFGNELPEGFKESPNGEWLSYTVANSENAAAEITNLIDKLKQAPHHGESIYLDFSNLPLNTLIPETEIQKLANLTDAVVIARPGGQEVEIALAIDGMINVIRLEGIGVAGLGLAGLAQLIRNIRRNRKPKEEKEAKGGDKKGKDATKPGAAKFPDGTFAEFGGMQEFLGTFSFEAVANIRQVLESLPAGQQARELLPIAGSITRIKCENSKVIELELKHTTNYESLKGLGGLRRLNSMPNLQLDLALFPRLYSYNGEIVPTWMNNQNPQITDRSEVELYDGKLRSKVAAPKPRPAQPDGKSAPQPDNLEKKNGLSSRLILLPTSHFSHLNLQSGITFKTNPGVDCKPVIEALESDSEVYQFLKWIPSVRFFNYTDGVVTGIGITEDHPSNMLHPLMQNIESFFAPNSTYSLANLPELATYYEKRADGQYHATSIADWMKAHNVTDRSQVVLEQGTIQLRAPAAAGSAQARPPAAAAAPASPEKSMQATIDRLNQLDRDLFIAGDEPRIMRNAICFRTRELSAADMARVAAALPNTEDIAELKAFLEANTGVKLSIRYESSIVDLESQNATEVPHARSLVSITAPNATFPLRAFPNLRVLNEQDLDDLLAAKNLTRKEARYTKGELQKITSDQPDMSEILASIRRIISEDGPEPAETPLAKNIELSKQLRQKFDAFFEKKPRATETGIQFHTKMISAADLQALLAELPESEDTRILRETDLGDTAQCSIIYGNGTIIQFETNGTVIPRLPNLQAIGALNASLDIANFPKLEYFAGADQAWKSIKDAMQELGVTDRARLRYTSGKLEIIDSNQTQPKQVETEDDATKMAGAWAELLFDGENGDEAGAEHDTAAPVKVVEDIYKVGIQNGINYLANLGEQELAEFKTQLLEIYGELGRRNRQLELEIEMADPEVIISKLLAPGDSLKSYKDLEQKMKEKRMAIYVSTPELETLIDDELDVPGSYVARAGRALLIMEVIAPRLLDRDGNLLIKGKVQVSN